MVHSAVNAVGELRQLQLFRNHFLLVADTAATSFAGIRPLQQPLPSQLRERLLRTVCHRDLFWHCHILRFRAELTLDHW